MAYIYKGLDLDIILGNMLSSFTGVSKDIGEAHRGNISIDLGIDLAKLGHSIAEGAVKTFELSAKPLPAIGAGISLTSLGNNIVGVYNDIKTDKAITDSQILNIISDTTGLIASAAGAAAVFGATAVAGVPLGLVAVGLGVISVVTGIIAHFMENSTAISDAVSAMNKAFSELVDTLGEAYDKALENISGALDKALDKASDIFDFLESALKDFLDEVEPFLPFINIGLYDPIALDLNNNGKIDTLSLENGVFFDHNGDKVAFKSSWVNSSDSILVRDIDGDGKITSGAELFGNFTKLKNGKLAKNGAEALKDLDDNNDGIIYSNDKAFNEILIWQDKNSDGISQKNELKTLREHNIKSIDLEFLDDNTALDKDNKQILIGSFSRNIINESKGNLASDIDFSVDTIQRKILDDTDGIIKGTGFVRNFNLSLNDEIKNAYESYKALNTKEQQLNNVEILVNLWAKTAKEYNEIDNPIQKVKINISSVRSDTTSSAIDEAIKRAENGEITLSDGVKISA